MFSFHYSAITVFIRTESPDCSLNGVHGAIVIRYRKRIFATYRFGKAEYFEEIEVIGFVELREEGIIAKNSVSFLVKFLRIESSLAASEAASTALMESSRAIESRRACSPSALELPEHEPGFSARVASMKILRENLSFMLF